MTPTPNPIMPPTFDPAAWRELCQALAGAAVRVCGQSYTVYVGNLSAGIDSAIARYEPEHRELALSIAREWGYATPEEIAKSDRENAENGYCIHGIDPNCCPAGCGDLDPDGALFDVPGDFGVDHADEVAVDQSLLEDLCRCLAFHAVQSENTSRFMTPPDREVEREVAQAKLLIATAGFDFDTLYPVSDRPVVSSTRTTSQAQH